jgi:processive 1,2-diacylglycerol beta-glucosyltransferase
MRVLIVTSSGGTAHDAAAYALRDWLAELRPDVVVQVEHVLESVSTVYRGGVQLYNWIQRRQPRLHQLYWRFMELEDLWKPRTVLFGRSGLIRLLQQARPDVLISTHPHLNRGHFDLAKRVLGPGLRCVICNTELDGGFGFSRNWVSQAADLHWTQTAEVSAEVTRRRRSMLRFPAARVQCLGPLLYPAFHRELSPQAAPAGRLKLVLASGSNGANNHLPLLEQLLPLADRLEVVALCGRRSEVQDSLQAWASRHPRLRLQVLGFQGPQQMAALYRSAWAHVARPGARTATEALVMACPLIFNCYSTLMPQELLAPRYFQSRGLELCIRRPADLVAIVQEWLDKPGQYAGLRQRYHQHRLGSDPQRLIDAVLGLVEG